MLNAFFKTIFGFGLTGIFILAVLDSTFFFYLPFAMDTIFIFVVSRNSDAMFFYVLLTVSGSLVGSGLTYIIISKTSKKTLEKKISNPKFQRVKQKLDKKGFWAICIGALLPPPFPFTPFTLAAGAVHYPFKKLLLAVAIGRTARFLGEAYLALYLGRTILGWLDSPVVKWLMFGIFVLAIAGTSISIYRWLRYR